MTRPTRAEAGVLVASPYAVLRAVDVFGFDSLRVLRELGVNRAVIANEMFDKMVGCGAVDSAVGRCWLTPVGRRALAAAGEG